MVVCNARHLEERLLTMNVQTFTILKGVSHQIFWVVFYHV